MTGLTQAYRADGTSEGDIQALRPGKVREIEATDTPADFVPSAGVGLIEIEAEGEALLHVRTTAGSFGPGMPLRAGARYCYALADGRVIGFSAATATTVRVLEGA